MDTNKFSCFVCNNTFKNPTSLVCHIKLLHSSLNIKKFYCKYPNCVREFDRVKFFEKHMLTSHSNSPCTEEYHSEPKKIKQSYPLSEECQNELSESVSPVKIPDSDDCYEPASSSQLNENNFARIDSGTFFHAVTNSDIKLLSRLYTIDTLTRNQIQLFVEEMKELLCNSFFDTLQESVLQTLDECQSSGSDVSDIRCLFQIFRGMFDDFDTEHKRMKLFKEQQAYIEPTPYVVGTANVQKSVKGQIVLEPVPLTGTFISTRKLLQNFLELPGVLDQIISYMNSLDESADAVQNVIQGSLWRNDIKPKFGHKVVLPLNISFDDFETNKDLGSHATVHKLGACHVTIACLPPQFQSTLDNMFLTLLFHSSDKAFGIDEVFRPVLEELTYLEQTGIEIKTDCGQPMRIYFALCLICGDNLGLNMVLGMAGGFRANYFCRFCKVHRSVSETQVRENAALLRNPVNYEQDLMANDMTSTGVKERCAWNDLQSFFITTNLYADIMHDIAEGVGDYDLCFIIEFIIKQKWVSYEELNDLVQGFYYGDQEFGNKPPLITADHVKNEALGFSATELLCLIRFFPLMVGHRVVEDHPVWLFFLQLRQLVDLLFAPIFRRSDLPRLKELIAEHHESYLLLSKRKLRPKYHLLVHYVTIIEKVGPLKPLWAMRWESKYKELRQAAHVTSCRKNISLTLAVKQSLKVCARFLCRKGLEHKFSFSPSCESVNVSSLDDYKSFSHILDSSMDDVWNIVKWVNIDGTLYKPGMVLVLALDDFFPLFGYIHTICITSDRKARFLVKELVTLGFNNHLHSYHVKENDSRNSWVLIMQQDILIHLPAHRRLFFDGQTYVLLRHSV